MFFDYEARHVGPFETGPFRKSDGSGGLAPVMGQWGMIRKGQGGRIEYKERPARKLGTPPIKLPLLKNNARLETVHSSPAIRDAWRTGRRCLIPSSWLQEPNWETGKCIWWHLARADQLPWMIAGIYAEWADPESGELTPNYAMLTLNVNAHPLLSRLHKPEKDLKTGEMLPFVRQDKRGEAHIGTADFGAWLHATKLRRARCWWRRRLRCSTLASSGRPTRFLRDWPRRLLMGPDTSGAGAASVTIRHHQDCR